MVRSVASRPGMIAALVLLSARTVLAQDTPIAGARLTVIEKKMGGLSVTIENLRDVPLVAWEVGVVRPGSPAPGVVQTADFTQPSMHRSGSGPIADVAPEAWGARQPRE
jgi:hypothetical protein